MKKTLRRSMRAVLRAMSPDLRHQKALAAARLVLDTPAWRDAQSVFVYMSTQHEIDTTALVEAAWRDGKTVLAPRVGPERGVLQPIEIRSWSDCLPRFRGIPEPIDDTPFEGARIDLIIVPALAFDLRGYRIGQGGGYYDRFLAREEVRAHRCGLAFEEQIVAELETEPHDEPMHSVVTDAVLRAHG